MLRSFPLRIDTSITSTSRLRFLFYASLATAFLVLAWLASLSLSQYVLLLVIGAAVISYLAVTRPIMLHVSQPPLNQRVDQPWQLLMRTGRGDALWQAHLLAVRRSYFMMSFEFVVTEPYQRPLSVTVFRDQVSFEQWQSLNILANVRTAKAQ